MATSTQSPAQPASQKRPPFARLGGFVARHRWPVLISYLISAVIFGIFGVQVCDVDAPHQSYISDDEDYRFQLPVAVFGQDQGRHSGGSAYEWGKAALHLKHGLHMRLVNVGAASQVKAPPSKTCA